jgi:ABC-type transport system substrate-binding protein
MPNSFDRPRSWYSGSLVLRTVTFCALLLVPLVPAAAQTGKASPGEMRWALHVTLAARWLDPAETEAFSTPFMVMYALHDAMVKPMPGGLTTPSLAESWVDLVQEIQQIIHDKVTAIPLFEQAFIWGVGPRVAEAGDGRIPGFSYSAPFEDLRLKD